MDFIKQLDFSKEIDLYPRDSGDNDNSRGINGNVNAQVTGRRTCTLEQAFKDYGDRINSSARNNDGSISRRGPDQMKGDVYQAQQTGTYNIETATKGKADQTHASTGGDTLSDGTKISKTDQTTDVVVETRENPWSKTRQDHYQAKTGKTARRELKNPKYDNVGKVAPSDQVPEGSGVIKNKVGGKEISSEDITSTELERLTKDAKNQEAKYPLEKQQEKRNELNKINLLDAVKTGALIGGISTVVSELIKIVKNDELTEEQFIQSAYNVLCGTIDGAARGATIVTATQVCNVAAKSLEAVPVMAAANVVFDFAKDLYKFAKGKIEADVLLCNTMENTMRSFASFTGGYLGGLGTTAAISAITGLDMVAVGAGIGAPFGPFGIVLGSVAAAVIFNGVADLIINDAKGEAYCVFQQDLKNARKEIERDPSRKVYIFADAMSCLETRKWSFKSLIPGRNLISDLTEYNLKKRAIKEMRAQMYQQFDLEKKAVYERITAQYEAQCKDIEERFHEQQAMMKNGFKNDIINDIQQSCMSYLTAYNEIGQNIQQSIDRLEVQKIEQNEIIKAAENRVEANKQINATIDEFMNNLGKEEDTDKLKEFTAEITQFLNSDKLLINKRYISHNEALMLLETA